MKMDIILRSRGKQHIRNREILQQHVSAKTNMELDRHAGITSTPAIKVIRKVYKSNLLLIYPFRVQTANVSRNMLRYLSPQISY